MADLQFKADNDTAQQGNDQAAEPTPDYTFNPFAHADEFMAFVDKMTNNGTKALSDAEFKPIADAYLRLGFVTRYRVKGELAIKYPDILSRIQDL